MRPHLRRRAHVLTARALSQVTSAEFLVGLGFGRWRGLGSRLRAADGLLPRHLRCDLATYTHDVSARREVVVDRSGATTTLEYDVRGNVTKETDAEGGITSRTFDLHDNLWASGRATAGDTDGRVGRPVHRIAPVSSQAPGRRPGRSAS